MSIIDSIATSIGSAVRSFDLARFGETKKTARRPAFLNSMANGEKWKGGDLGAKDAAYRRAIQNSWIFQAINYKSGAVASSRMYVASDNGGLEDDLVPIKGHALDNILRKPNSLMGRGFLWRYTHWWLDLSGNSYWFLAPDAENNLAEIWPLPANLVNPFPGSKERMIDYYEYTPNGQSHPIPAEYICHFRYPNPFDYFRGMPPLVAALLPADADSAMAHWNGQFFAEDNVVPSAIINVSSGNPDVPIDPQDVEAVKEQLMSDYSASKRKTVVTGAFDMAVQLLGWNAKDMDFLAGREFSRDEIYGDLGLPPGMLDKNATEANATVMDNIFKEKTLWPLLTDIYADSITSQIIVPWYGSGQVAAFQDVRPVNEQQKLQEATASTQDMTRMERRKRFWNLGPLGDDRDNEIPGAASAPQPGYDTGYPQLPNPQNAVIPSARSLDSDILADLRRWKRLALKSLEAGKPAAIEFRSTAIPADMMDAISAELKSAGDATDVKDLFAQWMTGEASTKAVPFGGKLNTRDDPFKPVKRVAERDLETAILEYFADLAARIKENVSEPGTF
jgi:HK97 family phage portal protein